jgi:hypothetical protein
LASFQKRLSGHTACDYHIQPHATCTMASLHGTLPYIYLDPPLTTMSIVFMFNIYHIQDGEPYHWSSLLDKAIERRDLLPLFTSIALLVDKHTLLPYPVNYTRWKRGKFGCRTCAEFQLIFTCSYPKTGTNLNHNYWFLLKSSKPNHSLEWFYLHIC